MKPKSISLAVLLLGIFHFSISGFAGAPITKAIVVPDDCGRELGFDATATGSFTCVDMEMEAASFKSSYMSINRSDYASVDLGALQSAKSNFSVNQKACKKFFNECITNDTFKQAFETPLQDLRNRIVNYEDELKKADKLAMDINNVQNPSPTAATPPGTTPGSGPTARSPSPSGGSNDDAPAGGGTRNSGNTSNKNSGSGGMGGMGSLMNAAMQMMKAQQQQPINYACNGPTPGPGCPPQNACTQNPNSLECKCGPLGPGGPECGRPVAAPTERNKGSKSLGENLNEPKQVDMGNANRGVAGPDMKGGKAGGSSSAGLHNGGGGGRIGPMNNSNLSANKAKARVAPAVSSLNNSGGRGGYVSGTTIASKSPAGGAPTGAVEALVEKHGVNTDPSLQGVKMHYGQMLQQGLEVARRKTAATRQVESSKEVRPSADDIFQAIREMYQLKDGTFLR